jgi:hypothetical protein
MRNRFILVALGLMAAGLLQRHPINTAHAAAAGVRVGWTYKGFTIVARSRDDLYASGPALRQLAATGANAVSFTVTWYTTNVYSTDIYTTDATASDGALIWAMRRAESLGLRVIVKPHLDSQDGQWRAYINPADAATWFANYRAMIDHYAVLAARYGADMLCIGAELISMSTNPTYAPYWRSLVAGVRHRFRGQLTYSANWGGTPFAEEYDHIPFWNKLDFLGISAYFPVSNQPNPSVAGMERSWATWRAHAIARFQARWRKPLLFTEVGYSSAQGTAEAPFNEGGWPPDQQVQANCYQALFAAWASVPWFAGSMFWFWSTDTSPDPNGTGFAVQNKAALSVVESWYDGPRLVNSWPDSFDSLAPRLAFTAVGRMLSAARSSFPHPQLGP